METLLHIRFFETFVTISLVLRIVMPLKYRKWKVHKFHERVLADTANFCHALCKNAVSIKAMFAPSVFNENFFLVMKKSQSFVYLQRTILTQWLQKRHTLCKTVVTMERLLGFSFLNRNSFKMMTRRVIKNYLYFSLP